MSKKTGKRYSEEQIIRVWLQDYNAERPHLGYRHMGRCPIETVMQYSQLFA